MSELAIHLVDAPYPVNRPREVAVMGAAGRTGRLVVALALERGHLVHALVRRAGALTLTHPNLTTVVGDIFDPDVVGGVVQGRDAVITLVAPESERQTGFFYHSTTTVLRAMANNGIRRFLCVSACAARDANAPLPGITGKLRLPIGRNRPLYADMHMMEDLVSNSPTIFTIARVVALTDGSALGAWQASGAIPKGAKPIARADLANFLVEAAFSEAQRRAAVVVTPALPAIAGN
ncbi:MAG: SDR family oxidoreductase [Ktedonobacterales bacterium]|nr:SDR family oxidoreductase [Ktedonobacterales bacterium]